VQNVVSAYIKLVASYVLTNLEKERFLHIIHVLKMPTHYVSSLKKRIVKDGDLKGVKSHDFHVMMQNILPLCMQELMSKGCRITIIHLCRVFQKLCAKILDPTTMGELKKDVAMTLVLLKQEFPPLFFNIMTHLLVHLVEELQLCGPVHTCWMYPIERYLKILKGYV
jgi:hypothetical protein